jgi:hypothetical protein
MFPYIADAVNAAAVASPKRVSCERSTHGRFPTSVAPGRCNFSDQPSVRQRTAPLHGKRSGQTTLVAAGRGDKLRRLESPLHTVRTSADDLTDRVRIWSGRVRQGTRQGMPVVRTCRCRLR